MATKLKLVTAFSIVAITITGALAYSVHHGFAQAFIVLPDEPVRMSLLPIPSRAERPGDPACCNHADRP